MKYGHYHIIAADIIKSTRFLANNQDDLYREVLECLHCIISHMHQEMKEKYPIVELDKAAGIFPVMGDSFWAFIPAGKEESLKQIDGQEKQKELDAIRDSFNFVIELIQRIEKKLHDRISEAKINIRVGIHTTLKDEFDKMNFVSLDSERDIPVKEIDPIYMMPVFNRMYCREIVVAKRLESAAECYGDGGGMIFSKEFVYKMRTYSGRYIPGKGDEINLVFNGSGGNKWIFDRVKLDNKNDDDEKPIKFEIDEYFKFTSFPSSTWE